MQLWLGMNRKRFCAIAGATTHSHYRIRGPEVDKLESSWWVGRRIFLYIRDGDCPFPRYLLPPMTDLDRLNTVLADRYTIDRELGAGGMATVYLAKDLKHDRDVALKVLKPEVASSLGADRFVREIKLAAKLTHPHILPLYDSGEADGFLYYVMPAMEGQSVRDRLARERQLPVDEAVRIGREIADALDYAHQHEVVHRDIKPENILLHSGHALVADFGIGKAVSESADGDTLTQTGVTIGTPAYMSPEQAAGDSDLDGRSDLYSLGCVLYEMLTGERAFTAPTVQAVIAKRFSHTPPAVTETRASVPVHISGVVRRLLATAPADRYAAGAQVAQALVTPTGAAVAGVDGAAEKSVAVLPFANVSADPENEFFSDGITEEIINTLAQIDGLRVASRTSSFYFKGKTLEMRDIAERLQVANVLEGSVRRAGNRLRITAQLIDVAKDEHLWSERYDREMEDIFAIQDEIARTIADKLKLTLGDDSETTLVKPHTENIEAYQLYLKGRALMYQRGWGIVQGLECIEQALALDPEYALAHAGLADVHSLLGYYGVRPPDETMPQARDAAKRAIGLGPDLAEAHGAFAIVSLLYEWDWATAEHEFLRALELNPNYMQARGWYALFFLQLVSGRLEEGVAEGRRGVEMDPLSSYATAIHALTLGVAGRTAEAVVVANEAKALDPSAFLSHWGLQLCCHWDSQFEQSVAAAEQALAVSGRHPWALAHLAATYADWGKASEAEAVHNELLARTARDYVQPVILALSAFAVGLKEEATALAQRSYEIRDPLLVVLGKHWPQFAGIREDPKFQEILKRLELP